jgi:UDP-N-acetylglucosamine acyltransferase
MPTIHPTAIIEGEVNLADDVVIGPHCVLTGPITIGEGTRLVGNVYLQGPLVMGRRNVVFPFACLGFAPQDLKYDLEHRGAGLKIGDGNTIREHVTLHRATSREVPTTIGDKNYFMASSHAGHDCRIGSNCTFANGTLFGGHVHVDDRVVTGGTAAVHQFCRVGRGCMLSGASGLSRDLPPWFMLTGINIAGAVNIVGLRRSGASPQTISDVRWVYRTLYRKGLSMKAAAEALHERAESSMVVEYIDFIAGSRRGICMATPKAIRGGMSAGVAGEPVA